MQCDHQGDKILMNSSVVGLRACDTHVCMQQWLSR